MLKKDTKGPLAKIPHVALWILGLSQLMGNVQGSLPKNKRKPFLTMCELPIGIKSTNIQKERASTKRRYKGEKMKNKGWTEKKSLKINGKLVARRHHFAALKKRHYNREFVKRWTGEDEGPSVNLKKYKNAVEFRKAWEKVPAETLYLNDMMRQREIERQREKARSQQGKNLFLWNGINNEVLRDLSQDKNFTLYKRGIQKRLKKLKQHHTNTKNHTTDLTKENLSVSTVQNIKC
jgi:hypothetical protein